MLEITIKGKSEGMIVAPQSARASLAAAEASAGEMSRAKNVPNVRIAVKTNKSCLFNYSRLR